MKEMANFQVILQKSMSTILEASVSANIDPISTRKFHLKPLDSLLELQELNDKLKDAHAFNDYFENLKIICGQNTKFGYKFFTRKFFTICSWAGGAKVPNTKFPFKCYDNVIVLFFKLIRLADPKFTQRGSELFFKNVIRNSLRRFESNKVRTSKSKRRAKKLSYSARFSEDDQGRTSTIENGRKRGDEEKITETEKFIEEEK